MSSNVTNTVVGCKDAVDIEIVKDAGDSLIPESVSLTSDGNEETVDTEIKKDAGDSMELEAVQPNESETPIDPNQFTEEDIIRMKKLSAQQREADVSAEQSVLSVADSGSNFAEHVSEGGDNENPEEKLAAETDEQDNDDSDTEIEKKQLSSNFHGGFMFNRTRLHLPSLPKNTVTILRYPFQPTRIPPGDNENEYRVALANAKVYLVGTAHFSRKSQEDVELTIHLTLPDMVMVELCPSRVSILSMDEKTILEESKNLNFGKIVSLMKQCGAVQGMLHVLLLSMSAHMTRELGMAPGGEFRAAYRGCAKVLCRLVLGDRPIHVTLQRALGSLSLLQKIRLFYHIAVSHKSSITEEEIERCKRTDMLEELLKELAGEFPLFSKIFVEERDLYMANALHALLREATYEKRLAWNKADVEWQPVTVVAVVGIGHVPGIVANWNKVIDVSNLLKIPEPTLTERFVRAGIRSMAVGIAAYALYRIGGKVINRIKIIMG